MWQPANTSLRQSLDSLHDYPESMVPVPHVIPGTAFFPGGRGYWIDETFAVSPPSARPVMVLGQDFGKREDYERSLAMGREDPALIPTWRELIHLLKRADIQLSDCFFTNAYMGLRTGNSSIKRCPGAKDPKFTAWCHEFFVTQLQVSKPKIILALGLEVARFLAPLARELYPWRRATSLKALDEAGIALIEAGFSGYGPVAVAVVAHPCMPWNSRHRRYNGCVGSAAERAMIVQALQRPRVGD